MQIDAKHIAIITNSNRFPIKNIQFYFNFKYANDIC